MEDITKEIAVEICRGFLLRNRILDRKDAKWEPEWICEKHPTGDLADRRNDCWFMPCPSLEPDADSKELLLIGVSKTTGKIKFSANVGE